MPSFLGLLLILCSERALAGGSLLPHSGLLQLRLLFDLHDQVDLQLLLADLLGDGQELAMHLAFDIVEDLGRLAVEELLIDWMTPLLTKEDADRLVPWPLWVSFYLRESGHPSSACQIDNENLIKN